MTDQVRLAELSDLLTTHGHEIPCNKVLEYAKAVLLLEDQMTENREHLTVLLDRQVIDQVEFLGKIDVCFNVFLKGASALIGSAACRAIYDFGPDDHIELLQRSTLDQKLIADPVVSYGGATEDSAASILNAIREFKTSIAPTGTAIDYLEAVTKQTHIVADWARMVVGPQVFLPHQMDQFVHIFPTAKWRSYLGSERNVSDILQIQELLQDDKNLKAVSLGSVVEESFNSTPLDDRYYLHLFFFFDANIGPMPGAVRDVIISNPAIFQSELQSENRLKESMFQIPTTTNIQRLVKLILSSKEFADCHKAHMSNRTKAAEHSPISRIKNEVDLIDFKQLYIDAACEFFQKQVAHLIEHGFVIA